MIRKITESKLGKDFVRWVRRRRASGTFRFESERVLQLIGVFAAAVLLVSTNILSTRYYQRWDATQDNVYTLSEVTKQTLEELREPVEVVVFLSQADPLTTSVRYLLDEMRSHTQKLQPSFVDPDRNPAEFISLQQRYGLFEGRTENGRLATEASIVLARDDQRWFITTDDILVFDEEHGEARPRLEQALTEGLVNLLGREPFLVCFTQGHRELSPDSGGAQGMADFRKTLERNNYRVRTVELVSRSSRDSLSECGVVLVVGPTVPFTSDVTERLVDYFDSGGNLFLLVGPISDDEGRILDPGLRPLLDRFGMAFQKNLVFERAPDLSMPIGIGGEVFLATPKEHAITAGLFAGGEVRSRVLMQLAQGLQLGEQASAHALLVSSEQSLAISSFRGLQSGAVWDGANAAPNAHVVAAAAQGEQKQGSEPPRQRPGRLVVIGTPSVVWSSTFRDPTWIGTRRLVENSLSWLLEAPVLIDVPEKHSHPAGLHLTEGALDEVQRYVLLYMPLCAALFAVLVVVRRRRDMPEEKS